MICREFIFFQFFFFLLLLGWLFGPMESMDVAGVFQEGEDLSVHLISFYCLWSL